MASTAPGCADQVPDHGLGRADRQLVGMCAEDRLDGCRLALVVERRRGAVGIDVVDLFRLEAGLGQGELHGARRALAALGRGGDVEGV